ncbi:MAG: ferredoxin [Nitrospirota bacterium]
MPHHKKHLFICLNKRHSDNPKGSCGAKGSEEIRRILKEEINKRGLKKEIMVTGCTCLGACNNGPVLVAYPEGVWYGGINRDNIMEILERHLLKGEIVDELLIN